MTSAVLDFCRGFGPKMEEKVAGDCSVGIGVVTDIGLCIEKNEDTWMSDTLISQALTYCIRGNTYQEDVHGLSKEHLVGSRTIHCYLTCVCSHLS